MIPYGRQDINQDDIDAVIDVLRSDFLTQGPVVQEFERALSDYCGVSHSLSLNSATSALHVACLALGVGPGDTVWTSPITFVASANCALYCGASVDFVDIDDKTYNISIPKLRNKLESASLDGTLPKVVIPVHMTGQSCDMESIHELSKEFGFRVLEDASHAIGARYKGHPVGSCQYSDICVFSFHPVKIITTGEGGVATTNNDSLAKAIERLRSHGITRDPKQLQSSKGDPWWYEQLDLGYNYRMTDIQAALGRSQMARLDKYVGQRNSLSDRYDELFSDFPLILPHTMPDCVSSKHLYVVRVKREQLTASRDEIFHSLRREGVGVQIHYIPVPMQPYYTSLGFSVEAYPSANEYYQSALSLPLFPTMTHVEQNFVVATMKKLLQA